MKYLFFDIECSNCYGGRGKIIEFGYVLTDENFKIITKNVFIMSPGRGNRNKFDQTIYERDPSFSFAYDDDFYFTCPEFPHFYKRIKDLMEDPETIVFGYAVDNDIRYLSYSCERYGLPLISYTAYEIQSILKLSETEQDKPRHLDQAFKDYCGVDEFVKMQAHLSRDDAFMAMRILQELTIKLNINNKDILGNEKVKKYQSVKFYEHYLERKFNKPNHLAYEEWNNYCKECEPRLEAKDYKYKITISSQLKSSKKKIIKLCDELNSKNYIGVLKIDESDFFLCKDEKDIERIKKTLKHPYEGEFKTIDDIKNI